LVIRVQTRDNEPVDKALRRLRKLCNNEGLTRTTKSKAYFEKPSERRRREARERLKAIRIACRAKETDTAKLMQRRRKARKAVKAARGGDDVMGDMGGDAPRSSSGPRRSFSSSPTSGPSPAPRPTAPIVAGARRSGPVEAPTAD
jgi:small subunit ribosomal protein S21